MGEKSIKKETKKPKKSKDSSLSTVSSSIPKTIAVQPELIKKAKKLK